MPFYSTILFDLDGTLTDPTMEMVRSAQYALQHFGITNVSVERLREVTSTPLLAFLEDEFGLTREQADHAFQHYWYYAGTFGVQLNQPYEGVRTLLGDLAQDRRTMCVATARQTRNAEQILRAVKMDHYFKHILGASEDDSRRTKKVIVFDVLCELPHHAAEEAVMVGDRAVDIQAAHDNGIASIGVTWGQETAEQVRAAEPTHVVDTVAELHDLLTRADD